MKNMDCNQIKIFINLGIIEEEDKEKKLYLFFFFKSKKSRLLFFSCVCVRAQ